MPIITISIFEGYSQEQKAKVAQEVTRAIVENMGTSPDKIWIRFDELSHKNFAIAGNLRG